eukprot:763168-Hanusia_phi.AAC.2
MIHGTVYPDRAAGTDYRHAGRARRGPGEGSQPGLPPRQCGPGAAAGALRHARRAAAVPAVGPYGPAARTVRSRGAGGAAAFEQ